MITAIADTHAAIWYLFSDPQLGSAASAFIDAAIANGDHIGVSAISLAEMVYLIEKRRIPSSALNDARPLPTPIPSFNTSRLTTKSP